MVSMKLHIKARRDRFTGERIGGWTVHEQGRPAITDWCAVTFEHACRIANAMLRNQGIPLR